MYGILKYLPVGTSLVVVQGLRLCISNAGGTGLIPGRGNNIPHTLQWNQKQFKKKVPVVGWLALGLPLEAKGNQTLMTASQILATPGPQLTPWSHYGSCTKNVFFPSVTLAKEVPRRVWPAWYRVACHLCGSQGCTSSSGISQVTSCGWELSPGEMSQVP